MPKKIITKIVIILITIHIFMVNILYAQNIGLGNVIFQNQRNTTTTMITHGFLIHEIGYTAIKLHLYLAGKNINTINYQGEVLETIKTLEILTKTNVISLLELAKSKESALTTYLTQCDQRLQKGYMVSIYLKQEMNILKHEMETCLKDKEISDKTYFDAVQRYDQKIMEAALADAITYETCASQKRIKYNATVNLANKLVWYLGLLQKKYDILFAKQEIVTKNFNIFKDNILPDLNEIDRLLKQYNF